MALYIHFFLFIPVVGFLLSLLVREKNEGTLSAVALATTGVNFLALIGFTGYWIASGAKPVNVRDMSIYRDEHFDFFLDFYFDYVTATFLFVGAAISLMVVIYSRYYMHKEAGFKRFFNTVLFFYLGYMIVVLAGNFETLFVGWEVLGISSFLLIAFYRLRYLPVKNAIKVFSIYRVGDVGILLAMWMSHHLWHENITFAKLLNYDLVHEHLAVHSGTGVFISLMILVAAMAKSAQLPFSAWLPRAMEGPTPSSAIFYGSLSVHIGAFLLLRTFPFWEHQTAVRWLIAAVGVSTAVVTTMTARVQSTIKGQIAYSSAAQIGIIFVEIAAGLHAVALVHFVGNAFLRMYHLLISPSVVAYLIREQFYNYTPPEARPAVARRHRIQDALYLMSLKEWHLEALIFRLLFNPLKQLRRPLGFLTIRTVAWVLAPLYLAGMLLAYADWAMPITVKHGLAIAAGVLAFAMVAKAYNERTSSRLAWLLIFFAHFFVDLAVTFNDHLNIKEATIYLSGIVVSGVLGYFVLHRVRAFSRHGVGLNQFHGLVTQHKVYAFVFLVACLGMAGFPITSAFFGEDLILTHIHEDQFVLATLVSITFIINGIAVIRIYARVFLGHSLRSYQRTTELTI